MKKHYLKTVASYALIVVFLVYILFPVSWLFLMSIKTPAENLLMPPRFPFEPTIANYLNSWFGSATVWYTAFGRATEKVTVTTVYGASLAIRNTLVIASASTLAALASGIPAAYSFSRFKMKRREDLQFYILAQRMAPPIAVIVPFFALSRWAGLSNTHLGIVLAHLVFNLPLATWLMKGFIDEIPKEIDESAWLDGCSTLGIIWRIILPLAKPGITAVAILCFLFSWNEFLFASILSGPDTLTMTVLMTQYFVHFTVDWGSLAATIMLGLIPTIILVMILQRYLIQGLTFGAVKG
nr:carbohydrate ABC transporter permease [Candidatus Njordarchaeum guaymaensis]